MSTKWTTCQLIHIVWYIIRLLDFFLFFQINLLWTMCFSVPTTWRPARHTNCITPTTIVTSNSNLTLWRDPVRQRPNCRCRKTLRTRSLTQPLLQPPPPPPPLRTRNSRPAENLCPRRRRLNINRRRRNRKRRRYTVSDIVIAAAFGISLIYRAQEK